MAEAYRYGVSTLDGGEVDESAAGRRIADVSLRV